MNLQKIKKGLEKQKKFRDYFSTKLIKIPLSTIDLQYRTYGCLKYSINGCNLDPVFLECVNKLEEDILKKRLRNS